MMLGSHYTTMDGTVILGANSSSNDGDVSGHHGVNILVIFG